MLRALAALTLLLTTVRCSCPEQCVCDQDERGRSRVTCAYGGMVEVPTRRMDPSTRVIVVTAPPGNPNKLTIGRIFGDFAELEEVRITRSGLPAIGEGSLWTPGERIRVLDLSRNNISSVKDRDFLGLRELRTLDLSHNSIAVPPSAPFRLLAGLRSLSLAGNRLRALVPRFFYQLARLERLDLGGNPLRDLDPENMRDVGATLRRLHLGGCRLERLHSLTYQMLGSVEELDLRDNAFAGFAPEEFRHLRRLKYLHLDGNRLAAVEEGTFEGHALRHLGLSRNGMARLSRCAFCNLSLQQLDLSENLLSSLPGDALSPLSRSLESLDLSHNPLDPESLQLALGPAHKLKRLALSSVGLRELSEDLFLGNRELRTLDLSHNELSNLSAATFAPLHHLEEVDLSHNLLRSLDQPLLDLLRPDNLSGLSLLHLHGNRWSCSRCQALRLLGWMRDAPHLYASTCDARYEGSTTCARCSTPFSLEGRPLHSLQARELEPCEEDASPQSRVLRTTPGLPMVLAVSSASVLVALAVAAGVVVYSRQGAVYYTKEGERVPSVVEVSVKANGHEGLRKAYFLALDRVDEGRVKTIRIKR